MARTSIMIVVELDESTDSPSGRASLPDGTAREFHGWLDLAATIDALARAPQGAAAETSNEMETP